MDRLSEEIGIVQSLRNSLNPIINVVLLALDAPPVFMRTKALKALGQIVTRDPSILSTVRWIYFNPLSVANLLPDERSAVDREPSS